MIECRNCGLGYDWVRQADAPETAITRRRTAHPTLDPPDGLETRLDGNRLELSLPRMRVMGVATLCASALAAFGMLAVWLSTRDMMFTLFLAGLTGWFGWMGLLWTFSRQRFTITPSELRLERTPLGGTSAVIAVRDLRQLAIARTRRGRQQVIYDYELWAQLGEGDMHLVTTRDENLVRYLEQRIEFHLQLADDEVEMVVPGAE